MMARFLVMMGLATAAVFGDGGGTNYAPTEVDGRTPVVTVYTGRKGK